MAITAGDPCGIGPEIILKPLPGFRPPPHLPVVIIGDAAVFSRAAARLHRRLPPWRVIPAQGLLPSRWPPLTLLNCAHHTAFQPGRSSRASGAASLTYLRRAVALWRGGSLRALVTAPVTKWAVARVQPGFTGHTEYLAKAMGAREAAMMFVSDAMRVVVVTRHIPLRRVPGAITQAALRRALELTASGLRDHFGIRHPRLAVCGLNPHAGEGRSASEERRIFAPVLRALRRRGVRCDGPFAADGFFAQACDHDAVVCGYHDQGLIPFKMVARDRGCQLTLGLPVVRTSPDHGSALEIAGRGIANPGSMRYALKLAIRLTRQQT